MYRKDLDVVKGIAILVVVLFHIGLLKSGYLGVDSFFVINGFFLVPSVFTKIENGDFSFLYFIEKRLLRLLPLIVIASFVCLLIGYWVMMPDHYENLAQSVIASNLFSENILECITTTDYWDVGNDYKPLMHLWYVGILFEFYLFIPILFFLAKKIALLFKQDLRIWMERTLLFFCFVSFLLFILPNKSFGSFFLERELDGMRFYFLPTRFFELGIGGLVAINIKRIGNIVNSQYIQKIAFFFLLAIWGCSIYNLFTETNVVTHAVIGGDSSIISTGLPLPKSLLLISTVFITSVLIGNNKCNSMILKNSFLALIGKMSYSIFIWHQLVIAFYRYCFGFSFSFVDIFCYFCIVAIMSIFSYFFIEKKIIISHISTIIWSGAAALLLLPSFWLYMKAGVSKDIPELECTVESAHRGMWGEYCDRVYEYDKEFPTANGKINVLVEGVSFGRDMANVLLESSYKDSINLSYVYLWKEEKYDDRIKNADVIFTLKAKSKVPHYVWNLKKPTTRVLSIGTKNYGACIGNVFKNRDNDHYFDSSLPPVPGYIEANLARKKEWDNDYVDFMAPVLLENGNVKVFTPDQYFISQDGSHLTPAGARWYAKIFDIKNMLSL